MNPKPSRKQLMQFSLRPNLSILPITGALVPTGEYVQLFPIKTDGDRISLAWTIGNLRPIVGATDLSVTVDLESGHARGPWRDHRSRDK